MFRDLHSQARRIGLCLLPGGSRAVQLACTFVFSQCSRQVATVGQALGKTFADLCLHPQVLELGSVWKRFGQYLDRLAAITELPMQSTEYGGRLD